MKNKKNVIIAVMIAVALLMATGYAYFATQLNINATGNITSQWNVYFESISNGTIVGNASNVVTPSVSGTSANMNVNLNIPGDSITYNIVLKNGGTVPAIIEDIDAVATGSGAIIYSISGLNIGDKLSAGASKTISVKIEYDPKTTGQPSETSKQLTVTIDAAQDIGQSITSQTPDINQSMYLTSAILNHNTAYADNVASPYIMDESGIDFSKPSSPESVTNSEIHGKGLYYTSTNTEDNMITYYFRGNVNNNYVKFGNYKIDEITYFVSGPNVSYSTLEACLAAGWDQYNLKCQPIENKAGDPIIWRIVRINEDGSVRMIKETNIGYYSYNALNSDNAYVGYMYGNAGSDGYKLTHQNITNSTIKDKLDSWYDSHLIDYSNLFATNTGFCNDRSIAPASSVWKESDTALGYGTNTTVYGPYYRLVTLQQPQFKCPNAEKDLFTLETSMKGNKKLTRPIGLLTADEVVYAGASTSYSFNNFYYLVNIENWSTMSPSVFENGVATVGMVGATGYYNSNNGTSNTMALRPVINLKSTVEITGGNGTVNNPYIIKTN